MPFGADRTAGLGAAAILVGLAAGWVATQFGGLFHLEATPTGALALAGALTVAAVVIRWPAVGLALLVVLVYLHLSDVLIRFHGLPSVLQLMAIPLALAALREWEGRWPAGLAPRALAVALAAYVLVVLLSTTVALDAGLADEALAATAKGYVLFLLVSFLATTPARVRMAARVLVGGGVLLGGLALLQALTGAYEASFGGLARVEFAQVYGDVVEPRAAGPLGDPNFFAQILLIPVPVALLLAWKERRWWLRAASLGAAAVIAAGVVVTYSRGGALALGAVVVLALFAARPSPLRIAGGMAVLALGLFLLPPDFTQRLDTLRGLLPGGPPAGEFDSSIQNRKLLMQSAWGMFEDHPVSGVGAGNYTVHFGDYAAEVGSPVHEYEDIGRPHYPHNLFLQIAAETGLLGLLAFGAALLLVFGYLRRAEAAFFSAGEETHAALASAFQIALVGYLITGLFLHDHFPRYLWLLLGLSAALARGAPSPAWTEDSPPGDSKAR